MRDACGSVRFAIHPEQAEVSLLLLEVEYHGKSGRSEGGGASANPATTLSQSPHQIICFHFEAQGSPEIQLVSVLVSVGFGKWCVPVLGGAGLPDGNSL